MAKYTLTVTTSDETLGDEDPYELMHSVVTDLNLHRVLSTKGWIIDVEEATFTREDN